MTSYTSMFFAAAFTLLASDAIAQTRPDFAGRWVDQSAAAQGRGRAGGGGRGNLGSGWGADITITQNANRLSLQYVFFTTGDMQPPIIYHFALDGTATTNKLLLGWGVEERVSRTRWEGEKLIITTTYSYPNPETGRPANTEFTQALTLENPTTLIVESTWPGVAGGAPTVTRTTYTKM
jgi:hypothetical protein